MIGFWQASYGEGGIISMLSQLQRAIKERLRRLQNVQIGNEPVREIIYDLASLDMTFPGQRFDLIRLTNYLSEGSRLASAMLVNGMSLGSDRFEYFLNQNGIITIFLPLVRRESRWKQWGVDHCIQSLILETNPRIANELLLVSLDGEHFAASLAHVKQEGVRILIGALPKTSTLLHEVADKLIPLEWDLLWKFVR